MRTLGRFKNLVMFVLKVWCVLSAKYRLIGLINV